MTDPVAQVSAIGLHVEFREYIPMSCNSHGIEEKVQRYDTEEERITCARPLETQKLTQEQAQGPAMVSTAQASS